jgi:hypothetical protein
MQIVWDQEVVEKLSNNHTVLELESFMINGESRTVYCVVPPEKIGLEGFATLDGRKALHSQFITAYHEKNYTLCQELSELLIGSFGGELDSFYEEILSRITK